MKLYCPVGNGVHKDDYNEGSWYVRNAGKRPSYDEFGNLRRDIVCKPSGIGSLNYKHRLIPYSDLSSIRPVNLNTKDRVSTEK